MTPFLTTIAEAYSSLSIDLSSHLFIFPGRRAGTFFLKHLKEASSGKKLILPRVMTMSDFAELVSGRVVAGRIELLFVLYQAYMAVLKESGVSNTPEFEVFRRWGETALSDFNEADMHDVDVDSLFKNVKDIREISSNFLTDEQKKVMNEYFGQTFDPEEVVSDFWKNFNEDSDGELKPKFRLLWQVLAPLYHRFSDLLEKKGLISSGKSYRVAADILENGWPSNISASRVVMVGFNALTSAERRIFNALDSLVDDDGNPFAEFFWDATGPVITDPASTAGRFVQFDLRNWPMPEWAKPYLSKSDTNDLPADLKVISVPSNSIQTKVVAEILSDMASRVPDSDFKDARIAVVLPDEQLLIPMLYSIPEAVGDVNLTMGYPLRLSSAYSFVALLRRLQSNRKRSGGVLGYYFKDLNSLLTHPFSRILFGNAVTKVKEWISSHHRFIVDIADIRDISPEMTALLRPLDDSSNPSETANWLDGVLRSVADAMESKGMMEGSYNVDLANIATYRLAIAKMLEAVDEYGVDIQWRTFLSLTERLLSAETVNFEGQPLRGLQVMGVLETRSLDFERIIIPSLNDRILPARRSNRTFISDSLRKAYGLPPVNYSESIFAYYFFRMISRAKEVVLLYDSRSSEGARNGDVSRYVLQLQYMYARNSLKLESRYFDITKSEVHPAPLAKDAYICTLLESYLNPGPDGKNLSASALTKYANCQLRFYFEEILKIKTDEESSEFIDVMTQGTVVHDVMEAIYLPEDKRNVFLQYPQEISADLIRQRMKNPAEIERLIRRSINRNFYHLPETDLDRRLHGSSLHVAEILKKQVLNTLKFDLSQAPFFLGGVEIKGNVSVKLRDGRLVNMRFAIDRLDYILRVGDDVERELPRIVDYKTGKGHVVARSMKDIADGVVDAKNLLQLLLYANIFDALPDKNIDKKRPRPVIDLFDKKANLPHQPIILEIYDMCELSQDKHVYPKIEGKTLTDHSTVNQEFLDLLEGMLMQLFDASEPFHPAKDEKSCQNCPFKTICWR